ncbi:hypothetical protein UFOVP490_9 [uncultured Caudovirales phage]|uniref:Uncharacterized protein n=1 Tax=uncultured Caudovirales phage TaxID=2100421 RepID=A0A6J5RFD8_9CAUD|nr:hypothetical protein UFOVP490_9 [uncultured Caudovirales phage]CAB4191145.1 hypothetical protein UFOVP1220_10 [uncultured Caudovirales phage]
MTTKAQLITKLKAENPKAHHDVNGEQIEITGAEYEALISQWADVELAKEAEENAKAAAKAAAEAKLAALGLTAEDLKALGI